MAADLDEIRRLIERALPGAEVEVVDETGTADHLRATVAAPQFNGLSRIDQHRLVKAAVQERMADGSIHALSVKTSVLELPDDGEESVTSSQDAES
jgi:stress-induced morphogen